MSSKKQKRFESGYRCLDCDSRCSYKEWINDCCQSCGSMRVRRRNFPIGGDTPIRVSPALTPKGPRMRPVGGAWDRLARWFAGLWSREYWAHGQDATDDTN